MYASQIERIGGFLCENQKKDVNEILTKSCNAFGERDMCVKKVGAIGFL